MFIAVTDINFFDYWRCPEVYTIWIIMESNNRQDAVRRFFL